MASSVLEHGLQLKGGRNGMDSVTGEITETQITKLEQEATTRLAEKEAEPPKLKRIISKIPERPDDIVIIANSDYKKLGKGFPMWTLPTMMRRASRNTLRSHWGFVTETSSISKMQPGPS